MRSKLQRLLSTVTGVALGLSMLTPPAALGAQERAGSTCQHVNVPVKLSGTLGPLKMHGKLCVPNAGTSAVQVLVPGATYTSTYWDFPYRPERYSYRRAANEAGFATFAIDRLGSGKSSKPPSALTTATTQASAIHQVVQRLRMGAIRDIRFDQVGLSCHSLGSAMCVLEAAVNDDVDAVLLTGYSHQLNLLTSAEIFIRSLRPAPQDPDIGSRYADPGYLTTWPGTRQQDFYTPAVPEPEVLEIDEATKDVISSGEVADGIAIGIQTDISKSINVPVMVATGEHDTLFCGESRDCVNDEVLARREAPFYSKAAKLETMVLPGSGHDVNLVRNTQLYQQRALNWYDRVLN